jgi:very-short-patch-repair endonuclease
LRLASKQRNGHALHQELASTIREHAFFKTYGGVTQAVLKHLSPRQLATLFYALADMNLNMGDAWYQGFFAVTLPQLKHLESQGQMSEFKPQELANTLYACAQLNLQPESAWMGAFWKASQDQLSQFAPQGLSNTLYACVVMEWDVPDWLIQGIRTTQETFSLDGWRQLYTASVFADLSLDFPEDIVDQLIRSERTKVSSTEDRAGSVIDSLLGKQEVYHTHWIPGAATTIDFFVQKHKLIIQVDGPTHYLSDGSQNGNTRFQTRLLEKLGYRVLRLGYRELNRNAQAYIQQQLAPFLGGGAS